MSAEVIDLARERARRRDAVLPYLGLAACCCLPVLLALLMCVQAADFAVSAWERRS